MQTAVSMIDDLDVDLNKSCILLAKSLVLSSQSMNEFGSSRPGSGSEHLLSHALDKIRDDYKIESRSSHGEQVAFWSIYTTFLQNGYCPEEIKNKVIKTTKEIIQKIKDVGLPSNCQQLGFEPEHVIKAVLLAPNIRKKPRYTILDYVKEKYPEVLKEEAIKNDLEILEMI